MTDFTVSRLFSDHAVLCREKEIRIFGKTRKRIRLTAALYDAADHLLAQDSLVAEDAFVFRLPPQKAQTDCRLDIFSDKERVSFRDIAIGDVYLANGQSNMELELQNADEGAALVKTHCNPLVRYYNVPKFARETREADEANENAVWRAIAPEVGGDMSAAAYFFAMKLQPEIGVPLGIVDCYWGGTSIACWMNEETLRSTAECARYEKEYSEQCAGKSMEAYLEEEAAFILEMEEWGKSAEKIKAGRPDITPQELNKILGPFPWHPPVGIGSPFRPCGLFHTMLSRTLPVALTGVLYYQGEEDTWRTKKYDVLLTSYICMLRDLYRDQELPFINVQLPMWIDAGAEDSKNWPRLREAQYKVYRNVRNTGLAILIDEGEYDNIHPTNKRVVGERLYEEAMDVIYRLPCKKAVYMRGYSIRGNAICVLLSDAVYDTGTGEYLMEIAGEDGEYKTADLHIEGNLLTLSHPDIARPVAARYAWTDYAIVRLKGANGMPLAPFVIA